MIDIHALGVGVRRIGIGSNHMEMGRINWSYIPNYGYGGHSNMGGNETNLGMNHVLEEMMTNVKKLEDEAKALKKEE